MNREEVIKEHLETARGIVGVRQLNTNIKNSCTTEILKKTFLLISKFREQLTKEFHSVEINHDFNMTHNPEGIELKYASSLGRSWKVSSRFFTEEMTARKEEFNGGDCYFDISYQEALEVLNRYEKAIINRIAFLLEEV